MNKIAIIILNYKTYKDTLKCVKTIKENTFVLYKIFVVDNFSQNESVDVLKNAFCDDSDVEIIISQKNKGFSGGNNLGIKKAIAQGFTEFIITNSDVEFKPYAIDKMIKKLISEDKIGIIGPKIYSSDGTTLQHYCKNKMTIFSYIMTKKPFLYFDIVKVGSRLYNKKYKFNEEKVFSGAVSGCCFGIKKEVFDKQGLLDEKVFLYYEEDILAEKLRRIELKACIIPDAEIIHYGSNSVGNQQKPFPRMHRFFSAVYYLKNYTNAGKIGINFVKWLNLTIFKSKIKDPEYKEMYLQLKEAYEKL